VIQLVNILSARWLIAGEIAVNYIPLLVSFLQGKNITIDASILGKNDLKPFALGPGNSEINTVNRWSLDDENVPENSIAVIPVDGVLRDYDTIEISRFIKNAIANPSINSIFLLTNSPGGMVSQIDLVSDQITNSPKPVVTFVTDLNASAAAWLTSGSTKIILSSKLNRVGSIGVMTQFNDLWPMLEKFGIDHREIYATKSTEKNLQKRMLINPELSKEEQEKPLIEDLDFVNDFFHQAMIKNRKLDPESEVFKGNIYYAERAIELGLADSIDTLDNALSLAHKLGLQNKINQFNSNFYKK
jgi:ClpP class serine protease